MAHTMQTADSYTYEQSFLIHHVCVIDNSKKSKIIRGITVKIDIIH